MSEFYKRRYLLEVFDKTGKNCVRIEKLQTVFKLSKSLGDSPNVSTFEIYNLSEQTIKKYFGIGNKIRLMAGYEGSIYGAVFSGYITFKQEFTSQDGVNKLLQLEAIDGDVFLNETLNRTYQKGTKLSTILGDLVSTGVVENNIDPSTYNDIAIPRAVSVLGNPTKLLKDLGLTMQGKIYIDNNALKFFKPDQPPNNKKVHIDKNSGLVGNANQTETGIEFTCLLNPMIELNSIISVKSENISRLTETDEQGNKYLKDLTGAGVYRVVKIDYNGDFEGQSWYCLVNGVTETSLKNGLITYA